MNNLLHDLRYATRILLKDPGFTLVAVLALGLGIGASSAIFSVVNALLLRPLDYLEPRRLVMIWEHAVTRGRDHNVVAPANYLDWKSRSDAFADMAAYTDFFRVNLTGDGEPEELKPQAVTANFFSTLGVKALHGRTFTLDEDRQGSGRVVIVSHRLWQRRFGGDPRLVGDAITLNSDLHTVVGIMPPGFYLLNEDVDVWLPLRLDPARDYRKTSGRYLKSFARLKPGVSVEQASTQLKAIAAQLEQEHPQFNKNWSVNVVPVHADVVSPVRRALLVLLGAVGFVLLIACANVANLLLARAASRRREIAVRASLGAGRWRMARQLLTESSLLGLFGGGAGILFAQWGVASLVAASPKNLPRLAEISVDPTVLAFTVALSLATGLLFGLAPALTVSRVDLTSTLKDAGRTGTSAAGAKLRSAFVVGQFALAIVLLSGAGLLIQSFFRLQAVNPGFQPDHLLTMRVLLPNARYPEVAQRATFFEQAIRRIESLAGVKSVSAVSFLPFAGPGAATSFLIAGRADPPAGQPNVASVRTIMPGYFRTLGIPLVAGRDFTWQDSLPGAPHRFIVSEKLARQYLDGRSLGEKISVSMSRENPYGEVIGVVGDAQEEKLDGETRATVYYNYPSLSYSSMTFVVRTATEPLAASPGAVAVIRGLDG
ncbi:MAG: ABC transporter permease, partial [Gemmatimonadetes bacterium]|nr:ABC transporter permease [Gemmatimonadota bacterium]